MLVNTAGGITGGDCFTVSATAGTNSALTLTTQAAERAYRSDQDDPGRVETRLQVAEGARLNWLPQETILFEGCHFERCLRVDLAHGASALVVEPLVFGRVEMGEFLEDIRFRDRIDITRNGRPLYLDAMRISGNAKAILARPHTAADARALATLIFVARDAEGLLEPLRRMLPETGGASLVQHDLLVLRMLAMDSLDLRKHLIPILNLLTNHNLPKCWTL